LVLHGGWEGEKIKLLGRLLEKPRHRQVKFTTVEEKTTLLGFEKGGGEKGVCQKKGGWI